MVEPLEKLLGTGTVILASNPCRIRYCTQEIVVFRDDVVKKFRRHSIVNDSMIGDENEWQTTAEFLLNQGHLSPEPMTVSPVYWEFDASLRLFPLPDVVRQISPCACCAFMFCFQFVMADPYEAHDSTHEGCTLINPGTQLTQVYCRITVLCL